MENEEDEEEPQRAPINSSPDGDGSDVEEQPGEHPDRGEKYPELPADPWEDGLEKDI